MIDNNTVKSMKQKGPNRLFIDRPRLVLRTADAYANQLNTDKYMEVTAFNTAIYGNFLKENKD